MVPSPREFLDKLFHADSILHPNAQLLQRLINLDLYLLSIWEGEADMLELILELNTQIVNKLNCQGHMFFDPERIKVLVRAPKYISDLREGRQSYYQSLIN